MKLQVEVRLIDENGNIFLAPTIAEEDIPNPEQFIDGSNFMQVFERIERPAIAARNEAVKIAVENYINEVGKKGVQH